VSARVEWMDGVPAEVRAAVEPIVQRNLHRLPLWLHELRMNWENEWAKEQWRMAVEATTCDLTEVLRRSDPRPWGAP
jgi:hypothetical protein